MRGERGSNLARSHDASAGPPNRRVTAQRWRTLREIFAVTRGAHVCSRQHQGGTATAPQVNDRLYQALETEIGGGAVYTSAVERAINPRLKREWQEYREQTEHHVEVLREVLQKLGLDPEAET